MAMHPWQCTHGNAPMAMHPWQCTHGNAPMAMHPWQCTHGNAHIAMHQKIMGLTLDAKLTYSTHIHISVHAHKPLQIIKALTATGWGKQKETLMATYKAVMKPALEYASSIYGHLLHPRPALNNASHAECSIQNCHMMHTSHKHTTYT